MGEWKIPQNVSKMLEVSWMKTLTHTQDQSSARGQANADLGSANGNCSASEPMFTEQMSKMASMAGDSPEAIKDMVKENPEMLKEAADMMSKMSDEDLVSMVSVYFGQYVPHLEACRLGILRIVIVASAFLG